MITPSAQRLARAEVQRPAPPLALGEHANLLPLHTVRYCGGWRESIGKNIKNDCLA
jgi:hypothetical protein